MIVKHNLLHNVKLKVHTLCNYKYSLDLLQQHNILYCILMKVVKYIDVKLMSIKFSRSCALNLDSNQYSLFGKLDISRDTNPKWNKQYRMSFSRILCCDCFVPTSHIYSTR